MTREDFIAECKGRYDRGADLESLIRYLRESGCSKIDSIAVLAKGCGVGLGEAKERVHLSPTWDDRRKLDDQFHETIVKTVDSGKTE